MDKILIIIVISLSLECNLPPVMQGDDPISQKIKVYEFQGSLSTYSEHWQLAEDIRQYQI
jgi:hypothetical protein